MQRPRGGPLTRFTGPEKKFYLVKQPPIPFSDPPPNALATAAIASRLESRPSCRATVARLCVLPVDALTLTNSIAFIELVQFSSFSHVLSVDGVPFRRSVHR